MPYELDNHYFLPQNLRSELAKPLGKLIEGSVTETIPLMKEYILPKTSLLIGVGDVTANILVDHGFNPDIVITDGKTKRKKLDTWSKYPDFTELRANCPAAEITPEALKTIHQAIQLVSETKVHILIDGEEDLLVLPLIVELPLGSIIVYGQPNTGSVVHKVDKEAKSYTLSLLAKMGKK